MSLRFLTDNRLILPRISGLLLTSLFLILLCARADAQSSPPPPALPTVNGSVTIVTGGTFQQVLASVPPGSISRRSITIQNNNITGTDNCWVFIGNTTATVGKSILLMPGGSYQRYFPYVPSDVIQATCATTSDTLYVETQ